MFDMQTGFITETVQFSGTRNLQWHYSCQVVKEWAKYSTDCILCTCDITI